jgi:hypothetical protein
VSPKALLLPFVSKLSIDYEGDRLVTTGSRKS